MTVDAALTRDFLAALPPGSDTTGFEAFLERVLEDYRAEELPGVLEADLAVVLANFWRFGQRSVSPVATARVVPAIGCDGRRLGSDVLEIIQPDAPFLVDSVMGELGDAGVAVRAMFHPFAGQDQDRRSMIQVWLEPMTEARRAAVVENVLGAMSDVATAVGDFTPMRSLMARSIAELEAVAPGRWRMARGYRVSPLAEGRTLRFSRRADLRLSPHCRRPLRGGGAGLPVGGKSRRSS